MLKENRLKVILSSVIILLPILFGLIMWNELPDTMTTRLGAGGSADGFSAKALAVLGIARSGAGPTSDLFIFYGEG